MELFYICSTSPKLGSNYNLKGSNYNLSCGMKKCPILFRNKKL